MKLKQIVCLIALCALPLSTARAQEQNAAGQPPDAAAPAPAEPTELDLPVDESIKISVDPVQVSSLVDRVMETATVTVKCANALSAQVFVVPVDAPYGGRAVNKPRLIGADSKPGDGLAVRWAGKESTPYVKLFAVVRKAGAPQTAVRSRTLDLGLGGSRYEPAATPAAPPSR